jgi:hypothetical protein
VFSIWSDAPPQLSIGQSSRSAPKGWTLPDAYNLYRPASHINLTCKYLRFQAIRFKFHDRIKRRLISFQSAILVTAQGDKRLCASRRSAKLCPTSNKRPRSTQGVYFRSHIRSANQCIQISQGLLIDVPNHHTFYTCSTAYKKQGGSRSTLHIFYYFQHALRRVQKIRDSICMCSKFIILLIKFSKVFAAQQISSSMV